MGKQLRRHWVAALTLAVVVAAHQLAVLVVLAAAVLAEVMQPTELMAAQTPEAAEAAVGHKHYQLVTVVRA
jgi:ABC-type phosphonate transport system ATPase subunit